MLALRHLGPESERVTGYGPCTGGVLVITERQPTAPIERSSLPEIQRCALTLCELVVRLHDADVSGVRPEVDALVHGDQGLYIRGFSHLYAIGEPAEDVGHLRDQLASIGLEAPELSARSAWALWSWLGGLGVGDRPGTLPALAPFVGRTMLLTELQRARYRARLGAGGITGVRGPRGAGKTRLLNRAVALFSRDTPTTVATVRARPSGRTLSDLWASVMRSVASWTPDERQDLRRRLNERLGGMVAELAAMSAACSSFLGHPTRTSRATLSERMATHVGVAADALTVLGTRRRPFVLVVDDVHEADATTLAVLNDLSRQVRRAHVLVVVASRNRLPAFVDDRHTLGPLRHHELVHLIETLFHTSLDESESVATALKTSSEGWPLAAWTTIQEWGERGFVDVNEEGWRFVAPPTPVADSPAALCRKRLSRLSDPALTVLRLMAARGGAANPAWLAQVSGVDPSAAALALSELVERRLVVPIAGGSFELAHSTVGESLVAVPGAGDLRTAHQQIADWLDGSPRARVEQRAWHREHGTAHGTDDVLAELHAVAGAELLEQYLTDRAIWHFAAAMARTSGAETARRAQRGFAQAAALLGDVERTVEHAQHVLNAQDISPVEAVRFASEIVYALYRQGDLERAAAIADQALTKAGEPVPETNFQALTQGLWNAGCSMVAQPPHDAELRDALCRMYAQMAPVLVAHHWSRGVAVATRVVWLATGLTTPNAALGRAFYALGLASQGFSATRWSPVFEEAVAETEDGVDPWAHGVVHHLWGESLLASDDYVAGHQQLERAIEAFGRAGDHSVSALSLILRMIYGRNRENKATLRAWLESARTITQRNHNTFGLLYLETFALLHLDAYDSSIDALSLSERALAEESKFPSPEQSLANGCLAVWFAQAGDDSRALQHLDKMYAFKEGLPPVPYMRDTDEAVLRVSLGLQTEPAGFAHKVHKARKALLGAPVHSKTYVQIFDACVLARAGAMESARGRLDRVIVNADVHRQAGLVVEAHELLARWSGSDVLAAREHRRIADELAAVLSADLIDGASPEGTETPVNGIPVQESLGSLWPRLASALGDDMELAIDMPPSALRVTGFSEGMRYVVINLVFAARDATQRPGELLMSLEQQAVSQHDAAAIPGGRSGNFVVVELVATGAAPPGKVYGLNALREALMDFGGFLDVQRQEQRLVMRAYVQAVGGSAPAEILVVHRDEAVRQSVVSALLGLNRQARAAPDFSDGAYASIVISAERPSGRFERWIPLALRSEGASQKGALRFPFTVGDLKRLLDDASESSASGSLPA